MIVDDNLNFKPHIAYVCGKISKAIGIIYRTREFMPHSVLLSLYYSLVYPYLNYCNLVWGGTFTSHLEPLRVLQKRIIRLISFQPTNSHTSQLFFDNNLLKFDDIHKYRAAVYIFENGRDIFRRDHSYNTRQRENLLPTYHRLTTTQHSISYFGPSFWNSLPNNITSATSIESFKYRLKKHIISGYVLE